MKVRPRTISDDIKEAIRLAWAMLITLGFVAGAITAYGAWIARDQIVFPLMASFVLLSLYGLGAAWEDWKGPI